MTYKTDQEKFWAEEFGADYIDRNNSDELLNSKIAMWSNMLRSTSSVSSIRELGCNIGLNLLAIKKLKSTVQVDGVEIYEKAAKQAAALKIGEISVGSILEPIEKDKVDLTFTCGVLIHINPDYLGSVYENLVNGSNRYVLVSEYYNPSPIMINYRGQNDRLFKRDFAGELMDQFNLKLVDYGFVYRRDNWAPQDDLTWFLLEK